VDPVRLAAALAHQTKAGASLLVKHDPAGPRTFRQSEASPS
jgi:hypothetical protein